MTSKAEQLCQRCGMCCNGTLFLTTPLVDSEVTLFSTRSLPVVSSKRGPSSTQPCEQHSGNGCGIYDKRPATCRSYRCAVPVNLEAGKQSLEGAALLVEKVRHSAAQLESLLGWAPGGYSFAAYTDWWSAEQAALGEAQAAKTHARVLLKAGTLRLLIKRHFSEEESMSAT